MSIPVRRILFATDLSARCDRAAAQAVALCREWGAELQVISALEGRTVDDAEGDTSAALVRAEAKAREQIGDHDADILVLTGRAEELLARAAGKAKADLIVTGPPTRRWFAESILGGTIAALMRHARAPVLVVKKPASRPYGRVAAALDLSDASRATIATAQRLFARSSNLMVFHAFSTPFRLFAGDVDAYEAGVREGVTGELRDALRAWAVPNASDIPVIVHYGDPAARISKLVDEHRVDLVVTGTHGRTGLLSVVLGSVAEEIVQSADCDVLIVPVRTWQE